MLLLLRTVLLVLAIIVLPFQGVAQQSRITISKKNLTVGEEFSITFFFSKENKKDFHRYLSYQFPDITEFVKGKTEFISDKRSNTYKIIQYYTPLKKGEYLLPSLRIPLHDKVLLSEQSLLKVTAENKSKVKKKTEELPEGLHFTKAKPDAFFRLSSDKSQVFEGEGLSVSLAFYIAANSASELTFTNLYEQKMSLIKKSSLPNCWFQTNGETEEIKTDTTTINGKLYRLYKIHSFRCYPLDSMDIVFPSLAFKVITYATARTPEAIYRIPETSTFRSAPFTISVKELPVHPQKNNSSVGSFKLTETLNKKETSTGESFIYKFGITGKGNFATMFKPTIRDNTTLDIHFPQIVENIAQEPDYSGGKTYIYTIVPKEPGRYQLKDYFSWIYFNIDKKQYDTLKPKLEIVVEGESMKNSYIASNNDPFYRALIDKASNTLRPNKKDQNINFFANLIILLMLVTTAVIIFKR